MRVSIRPFVLLVAMIVFSSGACSKAAVPPGPIPLKALWTLSYSGRDPEMHHGLSFPDATNGWMVGDWGRILHSRDAGHVWERQTSSWNSRLTCVEFVNPRVGWAAGESNAVLRTRDGGSSWTVDHPPGNPDGRTFMALDFVDEQEGWIAHNYGGLLHTRDGGRTWAEKGLAGDALVSIHFLDAKRGWVLSSGGTVFRTIDGGQSWISERLSALPHAVASFSAIYFLDDLHGWIGTSTMISSRSGDAPPLFRTSDGGRTWSVQGRWPGSWIRDIQFQNAQSGWCAEMSGIYSTKDGGLSWVKELDSNGTPFVQMAVGISRRWVLTVTGNVYTHSE